MMSPQDMATLHAAAFSQSRPWSAGEFASLLSSPLCFSVGDSCCFALIRVVVDEAELLTIATHPDHVRQGLASFCMKTWQQLARQRGASRAFLEVAADNVLARALYAKCGYDHCGSRRAYYQRADQPPVDAIVMQRMFT
ncbi:MAG: ribosomal-protein-alanine N-acetyltransferase [Paracoccaceae bacterium]|jgi:ribosomal-protein-alanine N-acetyltransferase